MFLATCISELLRTQKNDLSIIISIVVHCIQKGTRHSKSFSLKNTLILQVHENAKSKSKNGVARKKKC